MKIEFRLKEPKRRVYYKFNNGLTYDIGRKSSVSISDLTFDNLDDGVIALGSGEYLTMNSKYKATFKLYNINGEMWAYSSIKQESHIWGYYPESINTIKLSNTIDEEFIHYLKIKQYGLTNYKYDCMKRNVKYNIEYDDSETLLNSPLELYIDGSNKGKINKGISIDSYEEFLKIKEYSDDHCIKIKKEYMITSARLNSSIIRKVVEFIEDFNNITEDIESNEDKLIEYMKFNDVNNVKSANN